jgi:predicted dehydrogenase
VDSVVICTPNAFHASQAIAALQAGKHTLVQKPLATSEAEALRVLRAAREAGRLLFVDYSYRFLATVDELRKAVREAGAIHRVTAAFHNIYGPGKAWFFDRSLSGGGALVDLGVHLIDLALGLVAPQSACIAKARLGFDRGYAVEDLANVEMQLDAIPFRLDVSWQAQQPLTDIFLRLECESATVEWRNVEGSFFHFRTERDGVCLLDRETTLRSDTLRAFEQALAGRRSEVPDVRVYRLLEEAYRAPGARA